MEILVMNYIDFFLDSQTYREDADYGLFDVYTKSTAHEILICT
jgi:hypothetical protein